MAQTVTTIIVLLVTGASPPTDDPTWYVRKDTWHESLIQSREALMQHESDQAVAAGRTVAPRLGPWSCLGPVSVSPKNSELETRILKEANSGVSATPASSSTCIRASSKTLSRIERPSYVHGGCFAENSMRCCQGKPSNSDASARSLAVISRTICAFDIL